MNKKLTTIDADTLLSTPLPATRFVVDRFLPQGLHILAGAPKTGKSWLALWLCLQVAKGGPVWEFPTTSGTVLYLCLEDSLARIQSRLFQITEEAPPTLHFATLAGSIGNGLEEQISAFLTEHPDTVLVVIDTLQKVRTAASQANPYAGDYQDIGVLKRLADERRVAVLLVHHLRKMNDSDPLNMISGTTGISGATDSSFVLKETRRGSGEATLYCTGRDIEYQELSLHFNKDCHIWELTRPAANEQPPQNPEVSFLSEFLLGLGSFEGSATELSSRLEEHTGEQIIPSALSRKLVRHASALAERGIQFSISRTREARTLHILCSPRDGSDVSDGKDGRDSL